MAILTNKFKREQIQLLMNNFLDSSSNHYYIGIGRSDVWNSTDTAPDAESSLLEERLFRNNLQSVKKVADVSFIVPRYNWTSGSTYSAYNDAQVGFPTNTYYVMNDNNQVYMVIQQAKNANGVTQPSTIQPSGNTDGTTFITADDYAWKFLYSISALDASKYIAAGFLPVKLQGATTGSSQASDVEQLAVQTAAVDGQITGYVLDSGGSGYTTAPTLTIVGDGTKAKATATEVGGAITKVEVTDSASTLCLGSGYRNAVVTQAGGSPDKPAKIRPVFAVKGGVGADPRVDLRSNGIMFTVKPAGTETGDFIIGNDFRQVGLIRNIKDSDGTYGTEPEGALFTDPTGTALKQLVFQSSGTQFTADKRIKGQTSLAEALIDRVDSINVWYHQNDATGYASFSQNENVQEVDGSGNKDLINTASYFVEPEVGTLTGDVLYIDNRASVTRASDQTEDIKIVIQI